MLPRESAIDPSVRLAQALRGLDLESRTAAVDSDILFLHNCRYVNLCWVSTSQVSFSMLRRSSAIPDRALTSFHNAQSDMSSAPESSRPVSTTTLNGPTSSPSSSCSPFPSLSPSPSFSRPNRLTTSPRRDVSRQQLLPWIVSTPLTLRWTLRPSSLTSKKPSRSRTLNELAELTPPASVVPIAVELRLLSSRGLCLLLSDTSFR